MLKFVLGVLDHVVEDARSDDAFRSAAVVQQRSNLERMKDERSIVGGSPLNAVQMSSEADRRTGARNDRRP